MYAQHSIICGSFIETNVHGCRILLIQSLCRAPNHIKGTGLHELWIFIGVRSKNSGVWVKFLVYWTRVRKQFFKGESLLSEWPADDLQPLDAQSLSYIPMSSFWKVTAWYGLHSTKTLCIFSNSLFHNFYRAPSMPWNKFWRWSHNVTFFCHVHRLNK